jgi:hypothetical protein
MDMQIIDKTHKDFNAYGSPFIEQRCKYSVMRTGGVKTQHGIVMACSWVGVGENAGRESSRFCFVWGGRCHSRFVQGKAYTDRGLITTARRFASSVANEELTLRNRAQRNGGSVQ